MDCCKIKLNKIKSPTLIEDKSNSSNSLMKLIDMKVETSNSLTTIKNHLDCSIKEFSSENFSLIIK